MQERLEPGRVAMCAPLRVTWFVLLLATVVGCGDDDSVAPAPSLTFRQPAAGQLSLVGATSVVLQVPPGSTADGIVVRLDGDPVTVVVSGGEARGTATTQAPGLHTLSAETGGGERTQVNFESVRLNSPDECEVLNDAECLLPFPSSRFLEPASTPTGFRVKFPPTGMPRQGGQALPVAPYENNDGFSPTAQILMHFPGGVDPVASNASRLLADTRSYGTRSLGADSPSVLLDAGSGERVLHFIESDVRGADPARRVLFLRPGRSLTPGHRYIVAMRNLKHADGTAVAAEPAFAALRDDRPTDVAAIESRRVRFGDIFSVLERAGVRRRDLVLAFDFVVASDAGITSQMLSMRDQAFAWLDEETAAGRTTFTVDRVVERDCTQTGVVAWRRVQGTYQVPLFLSSDPVTKPGTVGNLRVGADGTPLWEGFTNAPFTVAIPCTALADGGTPKLSLLLGHGLFGDGRGFVRALEDAGSRAPEFDYIIGATDWRGLSAGEVDGGDLSKTFIGRVILSLRNFAALPDRLRQGQLNTLVLARMMKKGLFNSAPAFQSPSGEGMFVGPEGEEFYFGASLGGIMGLMFAALSPDVERAHVDVPAINFSLLLQRATPFLQFESALTLSGLSDPMQQALVLGLIHEQWVRGESAGYATHITSNPLPGTNAKRILMTEAFLDQQVSNQATEIAARTLGLPSLVGSLQTGLAQIPDLPGPLSSALVTYDTGAFDLNNPAHEPFVPPLANRAPEPNRCDPHGRRTIIPAAFDQLLAFLRPGGQVENFCNGLCDAGEPDELPDGQSTWCNPL